MRSQVRAAGAISVGDFVRIVSRRRYWMLTGVASALVAFGALEASTVTSSSGQPLDLPVGMAFALRGLSLLPLMLPLAAGDLVAGDSQSGYSAMLKARGVHDATRILGSVTGTALAALLASLFALITASLLAMVLLPGSGGAMPADVFPFAPELLSAAPVVHLLLMVLLYSLAGTALTVLTWCIGLLARNPGAATLAGPLVVLAIGVTLPRHAQAFNPLENVMFANMWGAAWTAPSRVALYWVCLAGCLAGLSYLSLRMWEVRR